MPFVGRKRPPSGRTYPPGLPVVVPANDSKNRGKPMGRNTGPGTGRAARGFTLGELMVTVAIVGILAAVAYPSYVRYGVRANRSAAESFMLEVSSRQERYLVDARQYAPDLATLGIAVPAT